MTLLMSLGSISFSLFPILPTVLPGVMECRAFPGRRRQMWGCSVPGCSLDLVPWLLGGCETCMLGTDCLTSTGPHLWLFS